MLRFSFLVLLLSAFLVSDSIEVHSDEGQSTDSQSTDSQPPDSQQGVASVVDAAAEQPHVVMLIAEREYQTDQTLPAFAADRLKHCQTTYVLEDPQDRNRLVGVDAVDDADVLVVSVRRRTLPHDQLDKIRQYVAAGKPVIGIRTASHAFSLRNADPASGRDAWPEFDRKVFGGNYTNHHGNALKAAITIESPRSDDATTMLDGLAPQSSFKSGGSLYRVSPLAKGANVLMTGKVEGHPSEPVAWSFTRTDGGKSFYTSLGHVDDFHGDVLPQLLVNAIDWSLE